MSEAEKPDKKSKMPLIAGVVLALVLGGGGFYAVYSGMLLSGGTGTEAAKAEEAAPLPPMAFVEIEPLLVNMGRSGGVQHLRFEGHLEVDPGHVDEVAQMMPRIMDVLNSYLRAVEVHELRDPAALIRLRAQMLRRIQLVTGDGRVRDLLVTKFLIS